jgi:hypothetical protein
LGGTSRALRFLASDAPGYFSALRQGRVLEVEDTSTDPRVRELSEYCKARGVTSMLEVPVWVEGAALRSPRP